MPNFYGTLSNVTQPGTVELLMTEPPHLPSHESPSTPLPLKPQTEVSAPAIARRQPFERDVAIDALKGLGCLLMIFAHATPKSEGLPVLGLLKFIGGAAPVLFFAASGLLATFQSHRTPLRKLALFYGCFAVLGLSYNAIFSPYSFIEDFKSSIPQAIAIGVVTVALIEKKFAPKRLGYLIAALGAIVGFWGLRRLGWSIPVPVLSSLLFSREELFPLIPWVSFFCWGVACFRSRPRWNYTLGIICVLVFLACLAGLGGEKYFPSYIFGKDPLRSRSGVIPQTLAAYLGILSLSVGLFQSMAGSALVKGRSLLARSFAELTYLGRYSFPFLYVHLAIILLLQGLGITTVLLLWPAATIGSWSFLKAIEPHVSKFRTYFEAPSVWAVMAVAIVFAPLVLRNRIAIVTLEIFLGLLLSYYYPALSVLLKGNRRSPATSKAPVSR